MSGMSTLQEAESNASYIFMLFLVNLFFEQQPTHIQGSMLCIFLRSVEKGAYRVPLRARTKATHRLCKTNLSYCMNWFCQPGGERLEEAFGRQDSER